MILTAYFDESGTHEGSPVTLMSGWVGRAARWHQFNNRWRRMLEKRGLSHIHTKDLVQGSGEFRDGKVWPDERRHLLVQKAAHMTPRHALFGVTVFLRNDDYEQAYANVMARRPRKYPLDTKYGICFRISLVHVLNTLERMGVADEAELHLVLEDGHKNAGDAARLYNEVFCKHAPPQWTGIVKSFGFQKKRETPALQAADMLAYPSLQQELKQAVEISAQGIDCAPVQRFGEECPVFRVPLRIADLEQLRENLLVAEEMRMQWGRQQPLKSQGSGGTSAGDTC